MDGPVTSIAISNSKTLSFPKQRNETSQENQCCSSTMTMDHMRSMSYSILQRSTISFFSCSLHIWPTSYSHLMSVFSVHLPIHRLIGVMTTWKNTWKRFQRISLLNTIWKYDSKPSKTRQSRQHSERLESGQSTAMPSPMQTSHPVSTHPIVPVMFLIAILYTVMLGLIINHGLTTIQLLQMKATMRRMTMMNKGDKLTNPWHCHPHQLSPDHHMLLLPLI